MKILLAVDGSQHSLAAVLKCCEIVTGRDDTEIKVVSVADFAKPVENLPMGVGGDFGITIDKELKKRADALVAATKFTLEQKLVEQAEVDAKVLRGSPKIEIVEEAEKWGADLIIVGSHGYGFFERMLIGSVSNAVVHHAPCSVLIVKTAENDEAEQE